MANSSPNKVFSNAANRSSVRVEADRKRKATEQVKEKRRRSKYSHIDDSAVARMFIAGMTEEFLQSKLRMTFLVIC